MPSHFKIRRVEDTPEDLNILAQFCADLAAHDGYNRAVEPEKIKRELFYPHTNVSVYFGERKSQSIGFVLFYECFSVYRMERGLYVSGVYIVPAYRNFGYGAKLLRHAAQYAVEHEFQFIQGMVGEKNEKALTLYKKLNARVAPGWTFCQIPCEILKKYVGKLKGEKESTKRVRSD